MLALGHGVRLSGVVGDTRTIIGRLYIVPAEGIDKAT